MDYQRELYIFKHLLQHLLGYIIYTTVTITHMAACIQYYSHKFLLSQILDVCKTNVPTNVV